MKFSQMLTKANEILAIVLISLLFSHILLAKESPRTAYFESSHVYFNPLYIQDHRITINPDKVSVDIILNTAKDYLQDPWSEVAIHMRNRKTQRYRALFQFDGNVCHLLGSSGTNFLTLWVQSYLKLGNMPQSCPLQKGNYSWRGLRLDNLKIPQLFAGTYKVTVYTYYRKKSLKEIITNVTVGWELK